MATIRQRQKSKPKIFDKAGKILVTVTTSHYDDDEGEVEETEEVWVEKFDTEPAYVRAETGVTKNLGNYESLRVSVAITVPCYKERIDPTYEWASGKVATLLAEEVERCSEDSYAK